MSCRGHAIPGPAVLLGAAAPISASKSLRRPCGTGCGQGGWDALSAGEDAFADIVAPDLSVLHVAERGLELHMTRLVHHVTHLFLLRVPALPMPQNSGRAGAPAARTLIQGRSLIRSGLPNLHPVREGDSRAEVRLLSVGVDRDQPPFALVVGSGLADQHGEAAGGQGGCRPRRARSAVGPSRDHAVAGADRGAADAQAGHRLAVLGTRGQLERRSARIDRQWLKAVTRAPGGKGVRGRAIGAPGAVAGGFLGVAGSVGCQSRGDCPSMEQIAIADRLVTASERPVSGVPA